MGLTDRPMCGGVFLISVACGVGLFECFCCNDCNMAENNSDEYVHGKPSEGMCCLCTMEDIDDESQNYGKRIILICNCNTVDYNYRRSISHTFTYYYS